MASALLRSRGSGYGPFPNTDFRPRLLLQAPQASDPHLSHLGPPVDKNRGDTIKVDSHHVSGMLRGPSRSLEPCSSVQLADMVSSFRGLRGCDSGERTARTGGEGLDDGGKAEKTDGHVKHRIRQTHTGIEGTVQGTHDKAHCFHRRTPVSRLDIYPSNSMCSVFLGIPRQASKLQGSFQRFHPKLILP